MLQSDWIARILVTWYRYCMPRVPDPFLIVKGPGLQTRKGVGKKKWRVRDQYSDKLHEVLDREQTSTVYVSFLYPPCLVPVSPL